MFKIAKEITEANPMSAGNGGLMRIAAGLIPLKYSDNDWDVIHLASELNDLTHPHPDSNSSCRYFLYLLNLKHSDFIKPNPWETGGEQEFLNEVCWHVDN